MVTRSRTAQDRRNVSRLETFLECSFEYDGKNYDAVIINISLKGAYLSSRFMPPAGSMVRVTAKLPGIGKPLVLEGPVRRGTSGMTDHGMKSRFGMSFSSAPLQLSSVISRLVSKMQ